MNTHNGWLLNANEGLEHSTCKKRILECWDIQSTSERNEAICWDTSVLYGHIGAVDNLKEDFKCLDEK